jgi:hypothetical protein
MTFKQEIFEMRRAHRIAKYPSAIENYEDRWQMLDQYKAPRSAAGMEKLIIEYLRLKGHQAANVQTKGTFREGDDYKTMGGTIKGKSIYTKSGSTKGAADISSNIFGIAVHWEVKFSPTDRQSADQKNFEANVKSSGGFYFIVRNVDGFYQDYHELLKHPLIELNRNYHENSNNTL